MGKKSAEDYLDKLLNSVNDEKTKKEKFKETAKMLEDAVHFWEDEDAADDFEEASYMPAIEPEEKKSESEDILDALLSGAKDTKFGMNKRKPDNNPMYSRRVSRSEADFLREFEAELEYDSDDLSELFEEFARAVNPEDRLEQQDIEAQIFKENVFEKDPEPSLQKEVETSQEMSEVPQEDDGFDLGEMDLTSLVEGAADVMSGGFEEYAPIVESAPEDIPMDVVSMDEISSDVFADLFEGEENIDLAEGLPEQPSGEGIDLGNLGEEDLMNLLAGADDLSDIGNMLSQSEATDIPLEELDAFAAFAEGEMAVQQVSAEPVEEELGLGDKGAKGKKGGLIGKLKGLLGNLLKDDEDDEVELKSSKAPTAESLSGENADILAELDVEESKAAKKKAKKEKKKKEKKEKKPKKEKAPKKPKEPKPKKEKKPKEVDNTPPLPRGPVFMIWIMAASMVVVVLLGVNLIKYNSPMSNAKSLQNQGHYAEAFSTLNGLEIKEKDMEFYNQLAVLATVDSELNAYEAFSKAEVADKAFDSLICAAGRCYINEENADVYGCLGQLEVLKRTVSNELEQKYGMTYDEAIEMYTIRDRDDYTYALYKKLTELGIDWE